MEQNKAQILRLAVSANVFSIGYGPRKSN